MADRSRELCDRLWTLAGIKTNLGKNGPLQRRQIVHPYRPHRVEDREIRRSGYALELASQATRSKGLAVCSKCDPIAWLALIGAAGFGNRCVVRTD
jgi:hypothetical protein